MKIKKKSFQTGEAVMEFLVELTNSDHLNRVIQELKRLNGIEKVSRVIRA